MYVKELFSNRQFYFSIFGIESNICRLEVWSFRNFSFLISKFKLDSVITRLSWIQLNFYRHQWSIIRIICLSQIAYQNNYLISSSLLFIRLRIHRFEYLEIFDERIIRVYHQAISLFNILCTGWQSKLIWFFSLGF